MSEEEILNRLQECIITLDLDNIENVAKEAVSAGIPAYKAITEGLAKGMEIVGQKFEDEEYFLAELIIAGDVMMKGMGVLKPYLKFGSQKAVGKVVVGTVKGDLHDIGKNLVGTLLTGAGFTVIDLGIDVTAQRFVEVVREEEADILGLSSLLSPCIVEMENVITALGKAGLRDKVKVIVGGATLTEDTAKKIGADRWAEDAVVGVNICKEWVRDRRRAE